MPSLTLPPREPRTLRAFWLLLTIAFGTGSAVVTRRSRRQAASLACVVGTVGFAAVGLARPQLAELPYRAWNRAGRSVGEGLTTYLSRAGFHLVRSTAGDDRYAPVATRSPGTSGWVERSSQPRSTYPLQDVDAARGAHPRDALDRFVDAPGRAWMYPVAILMRTIRALRTDADIDHTPPSDVYTLY